MSSLGDYLRAAGARTSKEWAVFLTSPRPTSPLRGKEDPTEGCWVKVHAFGVFSGGRHPWPSLTEAVSSCHRDSPGFANTPGLVHGPGSAARRRGTLIESLALPHPGFSHL